MDKTKVALIYRKNDLFDKYIPVVRGVLKDRFSEDFDLEQAFSGTTSLEEISAWYKNNQTKFSSYKFILSDETCEEYLDKIPESPKKLSSLDSHLRKLTYELVDAEFSRFKDLEISAREPDYSTPI